MFHMHKIPQKIVDFWDPTAAKYTALTDHKYYWRESWRRWHLRKKIRIILVELTTTYIVILHSGTWSDNFQFGA